MDPVEFGHWDIAELVVTTNISVVGDDVNNQLAVVTQRRLSCFNDRVP
jgi:hypothetical protein